jgi:DNA-binding MarR family transcriptional regulator
MSTGPTPPPFDDTAPEEARAIVRAFLSEEEEQAWTELLETHAALITALDARLLAEHNMPLRQADALMHIAHAEHGPLSVSELAERLRLSPSRTSRLAIDLERHGLVARQRDTTDSRSTRVAATHAGRHRLLQATPAYLSTVREHLFAGLNERDIKQLARILQRMQTARPPSTPRTPAPPISR